MRSVAFSPDGKTLASGSFDGSIRLASPSAASTLSLRAVKGTPAAYAFTPDGFLAVLGDDARRYPVCRVGALTFALDLCEERVIVPDLIPKVLAGDLSYREP